MRAKRLCVGGNQTNNYRFASSPRANKASKTFALVGVRPIKEQEMNTIEETAIKLGVSPRHIRRLVSERRIKHYKVGKLIRIGDEQIADYLKSNQREVAQR